MGVQANQFSNHCTVPIRRTLICIVRGGTLLSKLSKTQDLPTYDLHCLVRTKDQEEAVKQYGAIPIWIDLDNKQEVEDAILSKKSKVACFWISKLVLSKVQRNMVIHEP